MDNVLNIIVPCLNHLEVTQECLRAIKDYTMLEDYMVTLINDGSTDGTHDALSTNTYKFPRYTYLRNDSPSGFSKVVNQGIKYAQENEFSFVSIFNNDLIMKNNWVQPVFEAILQHPSIGMVGGTFYNSQIEVDGVVENCNNLFNTEFNLWEKGGPWTFRTEVFDNIGLFDEGYTPSWFEDDDILVRMALGNYIFGRVENAVGLHYDGVTRLDEVEKEYGKEFYTNSYNRFCEKWGIEQGDRPFIVYDKVFTEKRIAYIPIAPGKPIIIEDENIKYGKDFSDGTSNLRP